MSWLLYVAIALVVGGIAVGAPTALMYPDGRTAPRRALLAVGFSTIAVAAGAALAFLSWALHAARSI